MAEHKKKTLLDIAREVPVYSRNRLFSEDGCYCFLARALAQYMKKTEGRNV